jgi:hypothetical protein
VSVISVFDADSRTLFDGSMMNLRGDLGPRRERVCRRARGRQGRFAPLARWPEDGPPLTAAVRDGTGSLQVGAEGWFRTKGWDFPIPLPARCKGLREAEVPIQLETISRNLQNLVLFYFPWTIIFCSFKSALSLQTSLFSHGSIAVQSELGDGHKTKTIADRQQKM